MTIPSQAPYHNVTKSPGINDLEGSHGNYTCAKSPAQKDLKSPIPPSLEEGAIRAGELPDIYSLGSVGLLSQYAILGLIYGALPASLFPFLTYYLNTEGSVTTAASALLDLPWSMKVFFGMISDNFPITGYRRRPYMVIGWSICTISLIVAASIPMPDPYFPNTEWRDIKPEDYTPEISAALNVKAKNAGNVYIFLMTLATIGYLIADCAADGIVVEYAQREPLLIRGRTQSAIYTVRTIFSAFASALIGIGLNSPEYGGTFGFGFSFSTFLYFLAACTVPVIPLIWLFISEEKYDGSDICSYLRNSWELIQNRVFYQVIAYNFFSSLFSSIKSVAYNPIAAYWIKATTFCSSVADVLRLLVLAASIHGIGKYGLHMNWRTLIVVSVIAAIVIDAATVMPAVFGAIRTPWFWLGSEVIDSIPNGIVFIVQAFIIVELAGEGNEGSVYGLVSTSQNLASPFAMTISKNINEPFNVWNDDIMNDSNKTRWNVAYTVWISYALSIFSFVFLPLMPAQKKDALALRAKGERSKFFGLVTIGYFSFALIWSITINILSMFGSTQCLSITGGCKS